MKNHCIGVLLALLLSCSAASAQDMRSLSSRLCPNGTQIITGTVYTRIQIEQAFGTYLRADLIQAAALVAAVPPEYEQEVRFTLEQSMRRNATWDAAVDDTLFPMLIDDAKQCVRLASAGRIVTKEVVVGAAAGVAAGAVIRGVTGIPGSGAIGAVVVGTGVQRRLAQKAVEQIIIELTDDIADRLIRNPCTMTAQQALAEARRR